MTACNAADCESPVKTRGLCNAHYKRAWRRGEFRRPTVRERFEDKYEVVNGCWMWTAYLMKDGYGVFQFKGGSYLAHRAAYELHVGPIPDGMEIDHLCHNRACVNPKHLRPATHQQNSQYRSGAQANSKSGVRGVHYVEARGWWVGQVQSRYGHHFSKTFQTREEAEAAVKAARAEVFDFPEQGLAV